MAVGPNEERIDGANGKPLSAATKSNIKVDAKAFGELKRNLTDVAKVAKQLQDSLEAAADASSRINVAGGVPGKSGKNFFTGALGMASQGTNVNTSVTASGGGGRGGGYGGGIPGIMGGFADAAEPFAGIPGKNVAGGAALGQQISKQIADSIGAVIKSVDQRIERGTAYATTADRYNVQLQQLTGQSQMQVMQGMRQPLTQYRLGVGGVNAFMQFQAQTGQFDLPEGYAGSVAGIRALSGYSKSTAQVLQEQQQLMDPEVANRMFFMGGVNAFTAGGGLNDPLKMRQQIAGRLGLSDPRIARSALMPGSVTRARLADMGLGEEMQTEIIQYGLAQNSFKERGGSGQYDPSNPYHRRVAGIEDNLATSQEETSRVQTEREETFMRRQIDNMKTAEDINRALISALAGVEDKLSGLIGVLTGSKPLRGAVSGAARSAGSTLLGVGAGLTASGVGSPLGVPLMAVGGLLSVVGGMGDGDAGSAPPSTPNHNRVADDSSRDSEIMVPSGGPGSRKISLAQFKVSPRMTKLQSSLKDKLVRMMRERPSVGITSGYRDEAEQETLFYKQMEETTPEQSQVEWRGKHWKQRDGFAFTAPPGSSMHGVGLAADLFDEADPGREWIVANSARFGLNNWKAKGWRVDEPWHVQPAEVPRYRSQYEGGEWNPAEASAMTGSSDGKKFATINGVALDGDMGMLTENGELRDSFEGMTISEALLAQEARGFARFLAGDMGESMVNFAINSVKGLIKTTPSTVLTPQQVANFAKAAGWPSDLIDEVVAIAGAESDFVVGAHNPKGDDDSYGLMQINMKGDLEQERLAEYKHFGVRTKTDLLDPLKNMKAALHIFNKSGNDFSKDWTTYEGTRYNEYLDKTSGLEVGDPMPTRPLTNNAPSRSTGSTSRTTTINSSPTVNVSPVINFTGTPGTPDLRSIAQTVSRMIKEEVEMLDLRTA